MEKSISIIIELKDVEKSYKNKKVLNKVTFTVNAGDIFAFVGPNGVGKTTTIKAVTDLISIDSGEIYKKPGSRIGLIMEQNCLYPFLTARENMEYHLRLFGLNREEIIDKYLDIVGLIDEKDIQVNKFSKGMKRRLVIARALAVDPDILIMDEPLDGLDINSQLIIIRLLKEWVKQGARCIIYTSHDMVEIEALCNRIAFIRDGRIVLMGLIDEIAKKEIEYLRIVPGDNIRMVIDLVKTSGNIYEQRDDEIWVRYDKDKTGQMTELLYDKNIRVKEFNYIYRSLASIYKGLNEDE
ncbi:ABC-2 type transport system ATP-binding protein [Eubacterium ruminantium]|nr:ABC-2 type transport system ATP-binding protein [Eubacterium ruminantium]